MAQTGEGGPCIAPGSFPAAFPPLPSPLHSVGTLPRALACGPGVTSGENICNRAGVGAGAVRWGRWGGTGEAGGHPLSCVGAVLGEKGRAPGPMGAAMRRDLGASSGTGRGRPSDEGCCGACSAVEPQLPASGGVRQITQAVVRGFSQPPVPLHMPPLPPERSVPFVSSWKARLLPSGKSAGPGSSLAHHLGTPSRRRSLRIGAADAWEPQS